MPSKPCVSSQEGSLWYSPTASLVHHSVKTELAIKDLGKLSYFLSFEVSYTPYGLFLSQSKYAHDILSRVSLLGSKLVGAPLASNNTFTTSDTPFHDSSLYRSFVGALQYLTITRPDFSYVVNQASQFIHSPTDQHFTLVKRIMRYVKGTLTHGLQFSCPTKFMLICYSNPDWPCCIETRPFHLRLLDLLGGPTLLCNNLSAIFLSQIPVAHRRAKHIDIHLHFVREVILSGKLRTKFVPTKLQGEEFKHKSHTEEDIASSPHSSADPQIPSLSRLPAANRSHPPAIPPPAQPLNRYELFSLEHHRFLLPKTALIP
ncbi:hypothetical protein LXL04_004508 [Taraxacum kok-saghyz]